MQEHDKNLSAESVNESVVETAAEPTAQTVTETVAETVHRPAGKGGKRLAKGSAWNGKKIGMIALKAMAFLLTFVAAVAATLLISLNMICSDRFPSAQQMFVTTILETGQLKFLASWFLTPEEIQEIVDQNSMKELNAEVNTGLIQVGGASGNSGTLNFLVGSEESEAKGQEDIEIVEVASATYTGTMMIVKDPSRVSLTSIYPWRDVGVTLDELVTSNGAIGGINGGLYNSYNNSGGHPYGVLVSNGEIQYTTKTTSAAKKTTTTKATAAAKKTTTAKPAAKKVAAPKAGGEISVNGNKIIQTVQKEFSKKFE